MAKVDQIEAEFPPGSTVPDDLRRLCDFLDRTGYPISGYMRIRPEGNALRAWFGDDVAASQQFAGFGSGPDGSILAFWLYQGPDTATAPVVHLGSEGVSNMVLASDFREFLRLFAIGYGELGFDDLSAPATEAQSAERLRVWLLDEFGVTPPATGAALVREAQARHPNLEAWIQNWQSRKYPNA